MAVLNFAYGSNMSRARLEARVGACRSLGAARLDAYVLRYHKRGRDGSGKCDAYYTGALTDAMYGVVFELDQRQGERLDGFEGLDYVRKTVEVSIGGQPHEAFAYVVKPEAIQPNLSPFPWYHAFVLQGAIEANLPPDYIERLRTVVTVPDPDPARQAENDRILAGQFRP